MSHAPPVPVPKEGKLAALRAQVATIERGAQPARTGGVLPFGIAELDDRLAGGGLGTGMLHEAMGAAHTPSEDAAATLFLAGIAGRLGGAVLWALSRHDLFAPGLQQAGLPPDRVIYAEAGRDADVLFVMEEGLRHGGLSAVVGEVGRANLTATRRLQLAAEASGTTALMLRRWRRVAEDPITEASAAATRWRLGCAPSAPLSVPGIGRARWTLELARQRGGDPQIWTVEACDAEGRLALPARLRHRSPAAHRRAA